MRTLTGHRCSVSFANPIAGVISDAAGNLYGTTEYGGNGEGTVFKVVAGSGTATPLGVFNGVNGADVYSGVIADSAGNLYDTAGGGGASGQGTVFKYTAATSALTALASFDDSDGNYPTAGSLISDAAGDLFGVASYGGTSEDGTIFEVVAGSNTITTLASFNGTDGEGPECALVADAEGNLYGTAEYGGVEDRGTVFELTDSGFVTSVPEPASAFLLGAASVSLLMRRRSRV
jgi:uncharacterized repeat protein (TIGR03803 family)